MIFNIGVGMKNVIATLDSNLPADVTVTSGDEAAFSVVITDAGVPKEHTFQWYVNDVAVEGATEETYVRDTSKDKGVISVWCGVTNKAGTAVSRKANLTVKKLPILDEKFPADASAIITKTAEFKVTVSEEGYPANYTYQWYVNKKAVDGATKASYTRTAPAVGTESVYCIVTNEAGSVQSRTATFTVSAKNVFDKGAFSSGSFDWYSDSSTSKECQITDGGIWRLKVDGAGRFGSAWGIDAVDLTGINKIIFKLYTYSSTTVAESIGTGRVGVTNASNFKNVTMVAETNFSMATKDTAEYSVDVSKLTGNHYVKIVIDRTKANGHQDIMYVSAIRLE